MTLIERLRRMHELYGDGVYVEAAIELERLQELQRLLNAEHDAHMECHERMEQLRKALAESPCKHLLLQNCTVMESVVSENCEPCACWRAALSAEMSMRITKEDEYGRI